MKYDEHEHYRPIMYIQDGWMDGWLGVMWCGSITMSTRPSVVCDRVVKVCVFFHVGQYEIIRGANSD